MRKIKQISLIIALALMAGVTTLSSVFYTRTAQDVAAVSNPAEGASYYADNQNDLYYSGIDETLTGEDLIVALSTLTSSGFVSNSYSSLPNIYRYSDLSMSNSSKMVMVYTGTEVSFTAGSMPSNTNKEHVWPASWYGNGDRTESAGSPGADAHNVWPSASDLNSKRGSCAFDELDFQTSYKSYEFNRTDWSYGTAGDNDSYVWSTAFNYSNGQNTDALYPARGHRGAIARILMYVATRYRNDNRYPVMLHDRAVTLNTGRIGKLSTLLKWHFQEPPTAWEIRRNNEVATRWHHNRNPFVDHPEYAAKIYYTLPEPDSNVPTAAVKNVIETYGLENHGLILDKSSISLNEGETAKINIASNPNNEVVTWSSNNPNIASVDNSGNVNALAAGTATITAQGTTSSATCVVTVRHPSAPILINSLTFYPSSESLTVGKSKTFAPNILPTDASNKTLSWNSSNTGVAVVDSEGKVTAVNIGSALISASATDGSNKNATLTLNVIASTPTTAGWQLVTEAATLANGDRLIIASNSGNGFSAGSISGSILASVNTSFSSDKLSIPSLPAETLQLTLGGTSGAWTLANNGGALLGATSVKNLAFDSGTTTWSISISDSNATIQSKNTPTDYGRILYNVSSPRFTTYTSETSSSMLLPQLYRYFEEGENLPKSEAYDYASTFMSTTASECAALNVKSSSWATLSATYSSLSNAAKDYVYDNFDTDEVMIVMIERYSFIVEKYKYDNFMTDSQNNPVLGTANFNTVNDYVDDTATILIIILLFNVACISGIIAFKLNRRKHRDLY